MWKKILSSALCMWFAAGMVLPVQAEDDGFDEFMMEEFRESMESDYLNLHYTVRDYSRYGIEKPELILGTATKESYDEAREVLQESLDKLHGFNYDSLSQEQQVDYRVYERYLQDMIALNDPLLDSYFNPNTGILDGIITNFTEYVFRDREDFDDYLAVLDTVDEYFNEALELTRWQASQGVFLRDSLLDETEQWIADFLEKGEETPLIVIFDQKADAFEGLTDEERTEYKKRNREIVLNVVFPAYQKASEEMEKLRRSARYEGGVINYPGGEEYYRALASYKSSSDMTVEEQVDFLGGALEECLEYYVSIMFASDDIFERYDAEIVDFDDAESILNYHQSHISDMYPDGPEVVYEVSYLDPSVANDSTMAYYLNPPIDDIRDNVVRINGDLVSDTNTMYETLAHEGFPGHLYQITWFLATDPHPLRSVVSNMGYTEGWGMYTELSSWRYSGLSKDTALLHELDTFMGYVLNAYCDLAVNGLGWSVDDLGAKMDSLGFNSAIAQDMYDFVIDAPGQILPYGCGLAQFKVLESMAMVSMGEDFDLRKFNEVLLINGDRPFDLVEEDVVSWIEATGHTVSEDFSYLDCLYDRVMNIDGSGSGAPGRGSRSMFIVAGVGAVLVLILGVLIIRNSKKKAFAE